MKPLYERKDGCDCTLVELAEEWKHIHGVDGNPPENATINLFMAFDRLFDVVGGVERPFYDEANNRFVDYNHGAYIDESFDTSEYVDALKILGFRNLSREKIFDALLAYAYRDKRTV